MSINIFVQSDSFDLGDVSNKFVRAQRGMGAVVTFSGIVRDLNDDPLKFLEIEHYPGMTEKVIGEIAQNAMQRWSLGDVLVIHRYGKLSAGDLIMMVATAAPHRRDAFEAAEYLMDYLKSRAPFWKKENTNTMHGWVDAKDEDEDALSRW